MINLLAESQRRGQPAHVPYRNSKLTMLLQDSFVGHGCWGAPSFSHSRDGLGGAWHGESMGIVIQKLTWRGFQGPTVLLAPCVCAATPGLVVRHSPVPARFAPSRSPRGASFFVDQGTRAPRRDALRPAVRDEHEVPSRNPRHVFS